MIIELCEFSVNCLEGWKTWPLGWRNVFSEVVVLLGT